MNTQPQMEPQHKTNWILIIILIAVIIGAGIWYFMIFTPANKTVETNTATTAPTAKSTSTNNTAAIKSDSDLKTASTDLDSSDLNSIDTSLTLNDTDSSQF